MEDLAKLLYRSGLHADTAEIRTLAQSHLAQMRIGIYGGKTPLPMRVVELFPNKTRDESPVAVAICTETDIVTGTVLGDTYEPFASFPIPGGEYPAPMADVVFALGELLEDLLTPACRRLAVSLPFGLDYAETGAVLVSEVPRGLQISDYASYDLRAGLAAELQERGCVPSQMTFLPLVSAAHLGAMTRGDAQRYMSLYWGEHFNVGFSMPKTAMLKLKSGEAGLRLVDTGAGSATAVPFGVVDLTMDRDSQNPGEHLLDKMLSTRYLGEQYRFAMIKAAEDKLLSFMCGRQFLELRKLSTENLLLFWSESDGDNQIALLCQYDEKDRACALKVAEAVMRRVSHLVLSQIVAVLELIGAGRDLDHPVCIGIAGKAVDFDCMQAYLPSLAMDLEEMGYYVQFTDRPSEDLLARGTAQAVFFQG